MGNLVDERRHVDSGNRTLSLSLEDFAKNFPPSGREECTVTIEIDDSIAHNVSAVEYALCYLRSAAERIRLLRVEVYSGAERIDDAWLSCIDRQRAVVVLNLDFGLEGSVYEEKRPGQSLPAEVRLAANNLRERHIPVASCVRCTYSHAEQMIPMFRTLMAQGINSQKYTWVRSTANKSEPALWLSGVKKLFDAWLDERRAGAKVSIWAFESMMGAINGRLPHDRAHLYFEERICRVMVESPASIPVKCMKCRWVCFCQELTKVTYGKDIGKRDLNMDFCSSRNAFYEYALPLMLDYLREKSQHGLR